MLVVFAEQLGELPEILLRTVVYRAVDLGMLREVVGQDVPDLVDRRGDQSADDLARKIRLGAFQFLFDHRDKTPERLALGLREFHAGERAELQEKRHHAFGVDVDALEKIRGDDDKMGLETVVGLYLQDVLGAEDEERILFEPEFLKV